MQKTKIIRYAITHALVASGYVALVALLMTKAQKWFGPDGGPLSTTAFLLTFVLSAAIMGIVIFGKPVLWYLDNKKQEAVRLLLLTIAFIIVITIIVFAVLALRHI